MKVRIREKRNTYATFGGSGRSRTHRNDRKTKRKQNKAAQETTKVSTCSQTRPRDGGLEAARGSKGGPGLLWVVGQFSCFKLNSEGRSRSSFCDSLDPNGPNQKQNAKHRLARAM